ncbi:HD-GYP domain-containing protein (c-di-GMP phosphodiesterase class II) [Paenibacillus cellulosilyticus]|uniref:HD-GYP domain-containing protein (C-di-GMP phosphodiesterase class II) n=1 Tax=Paenibacillus cellulosilyticus TaxID=375489 RepID=A0A2V2Z1G2_9BACL|nr:HD-GYP domain-containing protein [Paenibacillus cellulosilyticus]PWW08854.1 HD-GYP domain-containing protein (c-di-GMP phosphodiesterase class II) [Paenibacillus cellulosilyticus]QKS48400.1 HD-GYP domain-containing protein [Paenibacillus cellulosilyticus]
MAHVLLSRLKPGDRLLQDVQTPLGNTLFHKGVVVTTRELDILHAFQVKSVEVETVITDKNTSSVKKEKQTSETEEEKTVVPAFQSEYEITFQLIKRAFNNALSGQALPILEIRQQMEKLIGLSGEYNILTFVPPGLKEDDYWYHNGLLTGLTSYLLARWNGFTSKDWVQIALAGLLHDIGNTKVDRALLFKPTTLTIEEREEVRRHTVNGYQLLKPIAALNEGVKLASLQHHEREDGSGYPLGIGADKIHPYAKIVAIADTFHAMTLNKVYQKASSPYVVLEEIQQNAFGKLEPAYVRVFIERVTQFHNGTVVKLNDGRTGEIVFSDRNQPTRPWVSIAGTIINLTTERHLHIKEVISN